MPFPPSTRRDLSLWSTWYVYRDPDFKRSEPKHQLWICKPLYQRVRELPWSTVTTSQKTERLHPWNNSLEFADITCTSDCKLRDGNISTLTDSTRYGFCPNTGARWQQSLIYGVCSGTYTQYHTTYVYIYIYIYIYIHTSVYIYMLLTYIYKNFTHTYTKHTKHTHKSHNTTRTH